MGWKSIKEHYGIEHIVHVREDGCIGIGSTYVFDLIVVSPDGIITDSLVRVSETLLCSYIDKIKADPEKFRRLYQQADVFEASVICYTYNEDIGEIVEKRFEPTADDAMGVTHDGCLMWSNKYSTDRDKVVRWAIEEARAGVKLTTRDIERMESELERMREILRIYQNSLAKFESLAQVVNAI